MGTPTRRHLHNPVLTQWQGHGQADTETEIAHLELKCAFTIWAQSAVLPIYGLVTLEGCLGQDCGRALVVKRGHTHPSRYLGGLLFASHIGLSERLESVRRPVAQNLHHTGFRLGRLVAPEHPQQTTGQAGGGHPRPLAVGREIGGLAAHVQRQSLSFKESIPQNDLQLGQVSGLTTTYASRFSGVYHASSSNPSPPAKPPVPGLVCEDQSLRGQVFSTGGPRAARRRPSRQWSG